MGRSDYILGKNPKDPVNILDTNKPPKFLEIPPWWMCVILYNTCESGHIESSV